MEVIAVTVLLSLSVGLVIGLCVQQVWTLFSAKWDACDNNDLDGGDPTSRLSEVCDELDALIRERKRALDQAASIEMELAEKVQKCREQAASWSNRVEMAVQQGNEDLAEQAHQRKNICVATANDLEKQIAAQQRLTEGVAKAISDLELQVDTARAKQRILAARYQMALAAMAIKGRAKNGDAHSVMDKIERKIIRKEQRAHILWSKTKRLGEFLAREVEQTEATIAEMESAVWEPTGAGEQTNENTSPE